MIAAASCSCGTPRRKSRSILRMSTRSARSRASEEWSAPKSSIATRTPMSLSSRSTSSVRSGSRIAARSVISTTRCDGSTPWRPIASASPCAKSGRRSSRGATLKPIVGRRPSSAQVRHWRQTSSMTQRPISSMSPDASAAGMKSSGETRPRSGSFQRMSASMPETRSAWMSWIGW